MGEDIAQTDPDSGHVRAAIDACELVISQDVFLSETARAADVVLPAAAFLEKDGTFVNFDRRFQRVRPALRPPGSARTDFEILHAVAAALGAGLGPATPAAALAECGSHAPLFAGITHERLDRDGGLHWPCRSTDDPGEHAPTSGRSPRRPDVPSWPPWEWLPPGEEPDSQYPYTLITGRRLEHYNSGSMTRRTRNLDLAPADTLDLNPDDAAARLGLHDGDPVEITSRRGAVVTRVHLTEDVAPGQLFLDFHFPEPAANVLTSDVVDGVTSCPEYKVTAVRLGAARPNQ